MANNDIQFAPGVLAAAAAQIDPGRRRFLPLLPDPQSFSAFLTTAKTWDHLGLFDTGFHPSYCEDLEYRDRLRADRHLQCLEDSTLQTAMASRNPQDSATIASGTCVSTGAAMGCAGGLDPGRIELEPGSPY